MALSLEQIRKNKSEKKNVMNFNSSTESRPYETIQKGQLTKPDSKIKKIDEKLEKIEKKTEKLLIKAKEQANKKLPLDYQSTTDQVPLAYQSTTTQVKRDVSFLTYQMLSARKLPKKILNHVRKNAFKIENDQWYSKIDSFELSDETQKPPRDLQLAVKRLQAEGWFTIIESSTSGYRKLKIEPENYGL